MSVAPAAIVIVAERGKQSQIAVHLKKKRQTETWKKAEPAAIRIDNFGLAKKWPFDSYSCDSAFQKSNTIMQLIPSKLAAAFALSVLIAGAPFSSIAQTATVSPREAPAKKETATTAKARPIPFRGKLGSVDKIGRTITVGARLFRLTPETKLGLGPSRLPATLNDAVIGEQVTGSYIKEENGKLTAKSVYFGKPAPSKAAEEKQQKSKAKQSP